MRAAKNLVDVLLALEAWFLKNQRPLPWREDPSFYKVWVSEIMLQQTQVKTMLPYYQRFMTRFPSVEDLAEASEAEVLQHWAGLGYYSRARNLRKAARKVVLELGGFPKSRAGWLELPGVGEYTAGAVLSIAANEPEALLDGNVERVLARFYGLMRGPSERAYRDRLWEWSRHWVSAAAAAGAAPRNLNQALMELGAIVCTPKAPSCKLCPVSTACQAFQKNQVDRFPSPKPPKEFVQVKEDVTCFVRTRRQGTLEVLLQKRVKGQWRAGLWDFVEGKPEKGKRVLATFASKHVVTKHRIQRTTHIVLADAKICEKLKSGEGGTDADRVWSRLEGSDFAGGSAFKVSLDQVKEFLLGRGTQFG